MWNTRTEKQKESIVIFASLIIGAGLIGGAWFLSSNKNSTEPAPVPVASSTPQKVHTPEVILQAVLSGSKLALPEILKTAEETTALPEGIGFLVLEGSANVRVNNVLFAGGFRGVKISYDTSGALEETHAKFERTLRENKYRLVRGLRGDNAGMLEYESDVYKIQIQEMEGGDGLLVNIFILIK